SILVEKEITETIARGTPADTKDLLSNSGVLSIVEVVQGATTYVAGDDYLLTADQVDWTPAGAEPDVASSYDVTYRYLDAVAADALTDTSITVSGGVDGGQVQFRYTFKLPRVDRICIDQNGQIAYLKGISSREQPQPPRTPTTLLALAEVHNDWFGTPAILNNGIRDMTFKVAWDLYNTAVELKD
ncbi:MAG: DUF4815 domain-containing protein, partial [Ilumatobacter sp.]|nr:DUF4815 domain-containing protein [Ilumatobacter sp.]